MKILHMALFVGVGVLLESMGYGVTSWQMWVMFLLVGGIDITSYIMAQQ